MQVQIIQPQVTVGYISRVLAGFQAYSHIATDSELISLKATVSLYKIKPIVLPEGQIKAQILLHLALADCIDMQVIVVGLKQDVNG